MYIHQLCGGKGLGKLSLHTLVEISDRPGSFNQSSGNILHGPLLLLKIYFWYIIHLMSPSYVKEPDSSSSSAVSYHRSESAPLLSGPSDDRPRNRNSISEENHNSTSLRFSADQSYFFDVMMEKVSNTKFAYYMRKLAVESEPGLTNAQLMLHNHDLKPVEPERRQWGWVLLHE